jgi:hypothetical protein
MTIHCPHPAATGNKRVSICGAVVVMPAWHRGMGTVDTATGKPLASGTKYLPDVDCAECLSELDRTPTDQEIADAREEHELSLLRPNQMEGYGDE